MPRATAKLLREARAGNDDALNELGEVIREPTQYKVSYLEIALAHLRVDQLPHASTLTDPGKPLSWAAISALYCVSTAAGAGGSSPEVKRETTTKLIQGLDGIIGWIYAILQHWIMLYKGGERKISRVEELFRHITQPLCALISRDDRLAVAIFSSQKVLAAIRQIWPLNLETHTARNMPMDKNGCAVIRLIERFTVHPSGRENFIFFTP
ncbi:hypothetical protein BKA70DRAFT_1435954 [Coprinopsis sp. MPI-PUGE-AT-0042]|nr:hypothetical protein BKA70DRAFT_1435954 [Coprinopsis sp. MPI-PUGE-AT-0042]